MEQRERILNAATELFLKDGFDRVSVDKIAAEAHVSKTAIYQQFGGKEPLFDAVIGYSCEGIDAPDIEPLPDEFDLRTVLKTAGEAGLYRILQPRAMNVIRLALGSYSFNPRLATIFWEHGPVRAVNLVAEAINRVIEKKSLNHLDAEKLSYSFINEILGPFLFTLMIGVTTYPEKREIDEALDRIIDSFLKRHGLEL